MEARHTPGPWNVDTYGDVQANGEDIARIATGDDRAGADAALIAAAPDMLVALQWLARFFVGEWEKDGRSQDDIDNDHAAAEVFAKVTIAKAFHAPPNSQGNRSEPA